jgi:hypothetical protein
MSTEENAFVEEMAAFQHQVTTWTGVVFPNATQESRLNHLKAEFRELQNEIIDIDFARKCGWDEAFISRRRAEIGNELADMFLLMLGLAQGENISLGECIVTKFLINQNRKWGEPNAEGFVEHIKDEDT